MNKYATQLPLAYDFNQTNLDKLLPNQKYTSLPDGIKKTIQKFQELKKLGMLYDKDLLE